MGIWFNLFGPKTHNDPDLGLLKRDAAWWISEIELTPSHSKARISIQGDPNFPSVRQKQQLAELKRRYARIAETATQAALNEFKDYTESDFAGPSIWDTLRIWEILIFSKRHKVDISIVYEGDWSGETDVLFRIELKDWEIIHAGHV